MPKLIWKLLHVLVISMYKNHKKKSKITTINIINPGTIPVESNMIVKIDGM